MKTAFTKLQFVAGHVALDFVNTVANRGNPEIARELIETVKDFRSWVRTEGHLPAARLLLAPQDLLHIRALRETLHSLFLAIARRESIAPQALAKWNDAILQCRSKQCLVSDGKAIRSAWTKEATPLDEVLCGILLQAADLVTSNSRGLIKECAGAGCGWLFLDRSQARKRKWCSMADCGNREKARQFYQRISGGGPSTT